MLERDVIQLIAVCPDPIIGIERSGVISLFNSASEMLLGYRKQDVLNRLHISRLYVSVAEARQVKRLLHTSGNKRLQGFETQLVSHGGRVIDIRLSAALLFDGEVEIGSVGFFQDLTEQKRLEERLKQLANTDDLTGLYNRRYFDTVLRNEVDRAQRYHRPLTLISADIDGFKQVNDLLGHLQGDKALRFAGRTIQSAVRKTDVASRIGGDEFLVLLPETKAPEAIVIAERVRQAFATGWAARTEDRGDNDEPAPTITMSLGVVELRPGTTPEQFLGLADASMYRAKRGGGNRVEKN